MTEVPKQGGSARDGSGGGEGTEIASDMDLHIRRESRHVAR
jgi:hypothetical protein